MLFSGSKLFSQSNYPRPNYPRPSYLRRFALAIEPLETRHMLSVVGLGVTLFEDLGGGIVGGEIAGDTIQPGQSFFAQITAEDLRESPTTAGITGLTIDVNWDITFITEIDSQSSFDDMFITAPMVTAAFPELRDGTLDNPSGTIVGLTGQSSPGSGVGSAIGASAAEEFSLLHFQALANLGSTYIDITCDDIIFADGEASSDPVNVHKAFSVAAVNTAPVAEGDLTVDTPEDTYIDIDLWDHVFDAETADADLTFILTDTAGGQAVLQTDQHTVRFTPATDFNGTVSFKFDVQDDAAPPDTQHTELTLNVNVTAVNDAPTAVDDTGETNATVVLDTATSTTNDGVLENDTDIDGDVLTITAYDAVSSRGATVTVHSDGNYTYDPNSVADFGVLLPGESLEDTFDYTINDGNGGTTTATVTITVYATATQADALDDTAETDEDTNATGNVLTNDQVASAGLTLTITTYNTTSSKGASVSIDAEGNFVYDPTAVAALQALAVGETTTDWFTYTIKDEFDNTDTATVTITITGVNDAPTAIDDAKIVDADKVSAGNALANDTDPDDSDTLTVVPNTGTTARGATFEITANGSFIYNPTVSAELTALSDVTVTDSFTYEISDGHGGTDSATVIITVNCVNDAPTAVDDTAFTNKDSLAVGNVLDNDTDPDTLDTLTVTSFDAVSDKGATVSVNSDGSFTYNPLTSATLQALAAGTTDTDTFTYTANDGHGGTSIATVTVTVSGDEDLPVANADDASTDENTAIIGNVLTNDQVPIGRTLSVTASDTTSAQGAAVSVNSDGSFTYNPVDSVNLNALGNGQSLVDTFEYTITDGHGHFDTATVTISVSGISDAPVIVNNTGKTVDAGESATIGTVALRTTDPDSATADLTYTLTAVPSHGALTNNGTALAIGDTFTQQDIDNDRIEYARDSGSTTDDFFKFTVSDGTTTLDVATFHLTLASNTLSGFVYVDSDNDGIKDAGEIGLGSVNVILTGVDSSGGAVVRSAWTAADGSYEFEDLPAGAYELATVRPENFVSGKETAGSQGGTVANGHIANINLISEEIGAGYNFGQTGLQERLISRRLFLASTPSANVVFQQAVGSEKTAVEPQTDPVVSHVGNTVTVTGTEGDDTIEFHAGTSQHTLIVNGQSHDYGAGDVTAFNFNTGAGTDFVTIYGTDGNETAVLRPGTAQFSGTNLAVNVTEAERILIDAKGGDDEATIYDSLGNDSLRANGKFASIFGDDFVNWAFDFKEVIAKATSGQDTSDIDTLTDLVLTKEGSWMEL